MDCLTRCYKLGLIPNVVHWSLDSYVSACENIITVNDTDRLVSSTFWVSFRTNK